MKYAELVAEIQERFERGLITQEEYVSDVLHLATMEVKSFQEYKITFTWSSPTAYRRATYIEWCNSEMAKEFIINDYIEAESLVVASRVDMKNGSHVLVFEPQESGGTCVITVEKQR